MFNALLALGTRKMANISADLKVARLLRLLAPIAEPIEANRKKIALDVVGDDLGKEISQVEVQIFQAQIDEKQRTFDAETIEFDLPPLRITADDLPREMIGDGWKNAEGLAGIIFNLGPLYQDSEAPKAA